MAWASFGTILAQVYWKSNLILVGMHLLLWILLFCWYSEVITPRPGWCNTCHCRTYFHAEPQGKCVNPQCAKSRDGLDWCRRCDCRTYRRKPHSGCFNPKCPAYREGQLRLAETETECVPPTNPPEPSSSSRQVEGSPRKQQPSKNTSVRITEQKVGQKETKTRHR